MNDQRRLEILEEVLLLLRESARGAAIVVEGPRDKAALEKLGVGGTHIAINQGRSLSQVIDRICEEAEETAWPRVILMLDWDRTGERLYDDVRNGLAGRAPVEIELRRRLGKVAHATSFEEVPADLAGLRKRAGGLR